MKRALVIGAEYEMGGLLCKSLAKYNWTITATIDDPRHSVELQSNLTLAELANDDAILLDELIANCDTVFLHLPDPTLEGQVILSIEAILTLVTKHKRHLMLTTNFYDTQSSPFSTFTFWRQKNPITIALPTKLKSRLELAADAGAQITVLCCGHSLSCAIKQSYLGILIKETKQKLILQSPSSYGINHYWTFLPDLAENIVHHLSTQSNTVNHFDIMYYPGHQASIKDIARCLALSSGKPVTVTQLHWTLMELISLFSPLFRGFIKMRSAWQQGVQLPIHRTNKSKKIVVHTPLELALQQSWQQLK
ncbi:hypothetical protein [Photobacterium nomapromontoriensis]|uniref:hypothetical protein n=1 Tax=Photobacterium nomapromontoriensis TaxID=2910237 RepID=UPI003D0CF012